MTVVGGDVKVEGGPFLIHFKSAKEEQYIRNYFHLSFERKCLKRSQGYEYKSEPPNKMATDFTDGTDFLLAHPKNAAR